MKIEGKIAVVLGAAEGVGKAYVEALLEQGARVCFGDVQATKGEEIAAALTKQYGSEKVLFQKCDVTVQKDVEGLFLETVNRWGPPDIAIDNAGIIQELNWEKTIDVNYGGVVRFTMEAFKHMAKDKGGKGGVIIYTASILGMYPHRILPVYTGTKHAIIGFMGSLVASFVKHGCRINAVCPVTVDTPLLNKLTPDVLENSEEFLELLKTDYKLKPSEVADVMVKVIETDEWNGEAVKVLSTGMELHNLPKPFVA